MERRCALLVSEGTETRAALESAERARKSLETELQEANEKHSDLNNQVIRCVSLLGPAEAKNLTCVGRMMIFSMFSLVRSVPVGPDWEEEAGGGSPDSAAGA